MAKLLKAETLEELKCSSCECYLSVGPVTIGPNGNICGRCPAKGINHVENKTVETLAKAYEFPCRYDSNGCTVNLPFGTQMLEHESECKFKIEQNVCPITDTCKWKGETENVFQHCVGEHSENILKSLTFAVNLETAENKKFIIKFGNNRLFLLHLLYNTKADGLSVTVRNLASKTSKQLLHYYDLMLKSPDQKNLCHFKRFESGKCVTKDTLSYVDKSNVNVELSIPYIEEEEFKPVCDLCNGELPLYMLKCYSQHYFCRTCCKPDEKCKVCNADSFLNIKSNYNILLTQCKNGVFDCCNAMNGCRFSGSVDKLKIHEQTCKTYNCFIYNCKWSGNITEHIEKLHTCVTDKNLIEVKSNTFPKGSSAVHIVGTCKVCSSPQCNTCSPKMLVIIAVSNLNNSTFVRITANNIPSHPNCSFGNISVTLGENFITYANKINPLLATNMSINYENSVNVSQELFVKHQYLRINVNDLTFVCDEHKI